MHLVHRRPWRSLPEAHLEHHVGDPIHLAAALAPVASERSPILQLQRELETGQHRPVMER